MSTLRWRLATLPGSYRIFREYEHGRLHAAFKACALALFRWRVHLYPQHWL